MQPAQALAFSKVKSKLPVPRNMIEAYRANINYARRELKLPEDKALLFSDEMLQKLLPDPADRADVRNSGDER